MKYSRLLGAVCACLFVLPVNAANVFVDFNDPNDLTDGFNERFSGSSSLISNPSGGVGDSGSLSVSGFNDATYKNTSFDFSYIGAEITVSSFFFIDSPPPTVIGTRYEWGLVSLLKAPDEFNYVDDMLSAHFGTVRDSNGNLYDDISGFSRTGGGTGQPGDGFREQFSSGTFIMDNWYELSTTFQNLGGGVIGFQVEVDNYGADGLTLLGTAAQHSETVSDTIGITNDSSVYAGFRLINRSVMDDFSISAVPLPAAAWLFGSGLLGLIGMARRKASA